MTSPKQSVSATTTVEKRHSDAALAAGDPLDAVRKRFLTDGNAAAVFESRCQWVDSVVSAAYQDVLAPAYPQGLALLAVGGYGRRELFPYSDIDLLILTAAGQPTGAAREALSRFLQVIWDSNLRLSHSVRTVRECCELHDDNIELNISLLDQRFLTGDDTLSAELNARTPKFLQGQRQNLARQLCKLSRERHAKFHGTIYHLEPHIKEAPGGLRDLHMLHWFTRLEVTSPERFADLAEPRRFLHSLRCYLHYRSGRDNNLLSFDAQEEFAAQQFVQFENPAQAMREYYRNARSIFRDSVREMETIEGRNNSLLAGFRDWRSRLSNAEFTVARERVLFKAPQHLEKDPELALRLFQFIARHRIAPHSESERRIREYLPLLCSYFGSPSILWPKIKDLLDQRNAAFALRGMHDTGLLTAIFPAWESIDCYVVRDFNHRYTVDEHTLITIENLELLGSDKNGAGRERFADILREIQEPAVLKFALLFHDVGKGEESDAHSIDSARLAAEAAERIGVSAHERELLQFLILNHLLLSAAMTSRDLDDPETARQLAHKVETIEKLKMLTLMTYCDIGAVNPTALSPWRMEQLWRIYMVVYRELTRELETDRIESPATTPERQAFLKGFPTRYLRVHTDEEIQRHVELEERRQAAGVAVEIRKETGGYQLTVIAKDRLFLFSSIAGALASFGMNILKAEAFANQQGTILDTFVFEDPQRTLDLNPPEMDRLRQSIERVVLGKIDVKNLLKNRPKPTPPSKGSRIHPRVTCDGHASNAATLVEVVAEDRPGLLYSLASTLSETGCSIDVVLVDTEAHRALDVFYVTANSRKLDPTLELIVQEKLLAACRE